MMPTPIVPTELNKPTAVSSFAPGDKVLWNGIGPLTILSISPTGMIEALSPTLRVQCNELHRFTKA